MKKNETRMILLLLIVAIIIIAVLVRIRGNNSEAELNNNGGTTVISDQTDTTDTEEFVSVLENGTKVNTSSKLSETKTVGNYEVSNIQLTEANGESLILADVKNISDTKTEVTIINITLLDKEGAQIMTIGGIIGEIEPGETTQLNTSATIDFANAYDFSIEIVQ